MPQISWDHAEIAILTAYRYGEVRLMPALPVNPVHPLLISGRGLAVPRVSGGPRRRLFVGDGLPLCQVIIVLSGVDADGNVVEQRSNPASFLDFSPSMRLAPGSNNLQFDTVGGVPAPIVGFTNVRGTWGTQLVLAPTHFMSLFFGMNGCCPCGGLAPYVLVRQPSPYPCVPCPLPRPPSPPPFTTPHACIPWQVLEVQASYLSNAKNLSMIVTRGGDNFTCPLVIRAPNGVEWLPVAPEDAVARLVAPVVAKAQNDSLEAVRASPLTPPSPHPPIPCPASSSPHSPECLLHAGLICRD